MKDQRSLSFFSSSASCPMAWIASSLAILKKRCPDHLKQCANLSRSSPFASLQFAPKQTLLSQQPSLPYNGNTCSFHPHHYAQQIASCTKKQIASPFSLLDQIPSAGHETVLQRYIGEKIFALLAKTPLLPQSELLFHLEQNIEQLKQLLKEHCFEELKKISRALLEEYSFPLSSRAQKVLATTCYGTASFLRRALIPHLIDSPELLKEELLDFFLCELRKIKYAFNTLAPQKIESLVRFSAFQSEMLLRSFSFPTHSPLYQITEKALQQAELPHQESVSTICRTFLISYPCLVSFHAEILMRCSVFIKHLWYAKEKESTYALFLKWHAQDLKDLSFSEQIETLKKRSRSLFPLVPFDEALAKRALIYEAKK